MSRELQLIVDEMNEEWMKKEAAWNQAIAEKDKESADLADAINYLCSKGRGNESARVMSDRMFREKILREYREAQGA
ncbi:MAG: hypothetical protein IJ708_05100 [Clostridia bacterium]|nr:hypothetical protein [Clostridia bacterium]MBR2288987.1 hypothetical protein [Clostridia bacterium]